MKYGIAIFRIEYKVFLQNFYVCLQLLSLEIATMKFHRSYVLEKHLQTQSTLLFLENTLFHQKQVCARNLANGVCNFSWKRILYEENRKRMESVHLFSTQFLRYHTVLTHSRVSSQKKSFEWYWFQCVCLIFQYFYLIFKFGPAND